MDAGNLLTEYQGEHHRYEALVEEVKKLLSAALDPSPFDVIVKGRAKDPAGFVIKAAKKLREEKAERLKLIADEPERRAELEAEMFKWADPMTAMSDKAGVRVIVSHLEAVGNVADRIRAIPELAVVDEDPKSRKLPPTQLGYLGHHLQVKLLAGPAQLVDLEVEIQLHTKAQNAWADVSHPLTYKPLPGINEEIERKVMRAVALVSLFDDEIHAARTMLVTDPMYLPAMMFDVLEKAALPWRRVEPDPEVSLEVLKVLEETYTEDELARYADLIDRFLAGHSDGLDSVMETYDRGSVDLLDQPEAVAIYERLSTVPHLLRKGWLDGGLPLQWLERLSDVFVLPTTA